VAREISRASHQTIHLPAFSFSDVLFDLEKKQLIHSTCPRTESSAFHSLIPPAGKLARPVQTGFNAFASVTFGEKLEFLKPFLSLTDAKSSSGVTIFMDLSASLTPVSHRVSYLFFTAFDSASSFVFSSLRWTSG
jgi:hypothetical protein